MKKILTIIVPSYNTEAYIDECLPTMLKHRYRKQLELLLVNDGSRDGTLEKLKQYEQRYPDTVTVIDKENGGHGSVINLGIRQAKGDYLKIVDGDDWVISKNLEKMIGQLASCSADLVIHPYIKYSVQDRKQKKVSYAIDKKRQMDFDEAASGLREVEIHAAAYRTSMLRDGHIQVREKCFYEDTEFNIYPIKYVRTVIAFDDPVYVYRVGTASQSISPQQAFKNRFMHRLVIDDCIAYYEDNFRQLSSPKQDYIKKIIGKRIRSQYAIYLKNEMTAGRIEELMEWDRRLKRRSPYFYKTSHKFPISLLRKDMHRAYPFVRFLYKAYVVGYRVCEI